MKFRHNSWDLSFREPFGALPTGSHVTLRVQAEGVVNIKLRTYYRGNERYFDMTPGATPKTYECTIVLPKQPDLLWYDFRFDAYGQSYAYGTKNENYGGEGQIYNAYPPSYQITLYDNKRKTPKWYTDGIMYQIFPDRFAKGSTYQPQYFPQAMVHGNWNDSPHYFRSDDGHIEYWDFFGGNLEGIIEKLDYLKSLNVTILYINPIFESRSNHKYDTANYRRISPEFGDEAQFKALCQEAKKRDMRIILDGVFSHTGDDSIYFNRYGHYPGLGAYQSEESPYYSWYRFSKYPDTFESWWGITSMPNTEELNETFQDYIFRTDDAVIRHWIKAGASGWRLDVADELPDDFIVGVKEALVSEDPDTILIGEVWEDASRKEAYGQRRRYFYGKELDAVMNYPFRDTFINFFTGTIPSSEAIHQMMALYEHYPRQQFMGNMNLIGSHDRTRILTLLGNPPYLTEEGDKEKYRMTVDQYRLAKKRLKLISLLQMTFPGVPCIYYGDEAGLQGFDDPFNRGTYPWGNEDETLLTWYQTITTLRTKHRAFITGRWYPLYSNDDLFVYARVSSEETILCLFNRNDRAFIPFTHALLSKRRGHDLLTDKRIHLDDIMMDPLSCKIIKIIPDGRTFIPKQ